jgi:hypothetical protein
MKTTSRVFLVITISAMLSCSTEPLMTSGALEAGEPEVAEDARVGERMTQAAAPMPTAEEIDARIAERMATAAAQSLQDPEGVVVITGTTRRTAVQEAEGAYGDCFSELPARRRACRRQFGRLWSESTIMRRQGDGAAQRDATRLVLGRIILSEANWIHDAEHRDRFFPDQNHAEIDAPAIYQVLRHTRRNGETLLGAMRRHAPHVSEARPITGRLLDRRMAWISRLQLDCDRPNGFPETDREGNPIDWDDDGYRERCELLFTYAQRLLDGDAEVLGPWTDVPLVTWGGRCEDAQGACDDHLASHRGLVPFEATSGPLTANRFWCRPGR